MENIPQHIKILEERLNYLRSEHAKLADGSKRFELKKDIEQTEKELDEALEQFEKEKKKAGRKSPKCS